MKGVYILLIFISDKIKIEIGSLGKVDFDKGYYAYVGSAQNNLLKRVERHKSKDKKKRWHVDYLLLNNNSNISKIFYKEAGKEEECMASGILMKKYSYVAKFGCSDCRCKSHLFRLNRKEDIDILGFKELRIK